MREDVPLGTLLRRHRRAAAPWFRSASGPPPWASSAPLAYGSGITAALAYSGALSKIRMNKHKTRNG
jgi:hypothetical protein